MLAEGCINLFKLRIIQAVRDSPLHEFLHTIADEHSHILDGVFWHIVLPQSEICTCS